MCSRLFFIRVPGMVQVRSSQLISSQVAIRASMLRTPVKAVKVVDYTGMEHIKVIDAP